MGTAETGRRRLAVTFSRQKYSRCHAIAEQLIDALSAAPDVFSGQWALFDQNLVHKVLEDMHLPARLAEFMPEDREHPLRGLINELVGLHPSLYELFNRTCDTIRNLARIGNVVVIGRGAHIVTSDLPQVVHFRVICETQARVRRAMQLEGWDATQATRQVRQDDTARSAYIREHFARDIDDPLAYDAVFNTSRLSDAEVVTAIIRILRLRLRRISPLLT
jgi:hypothetical protein